MRDKYANIAPCPEHRRHEVGDDVIYGNNAKAVITEVLLDGRRYKLEVTNNRRKSHQKEDNFVTEDRDAVWTDLFKRDSVNLDTPMQSNPKYYPISFQQRDVSGLLGIIYSEYGFDFNPDYQRGHVWELEDKVALIDSIMHKRDIGKFVINHRQYNDDGPLAEVIDGKQRMTAIKEFYEDGFRYNGLLYSELHPMDRATFENKAVSLAMLEEVDRKEILKTFLAVNITGRQQNQKHIENVKKLLEEEK